MAPPHFRRPAADARSGERLDRQAEELVRSNKALTEFAHVLAHDLSSPLRGVLFYSSMLEERCNRKLDDEECLQLQYITQTTQGMVVLIDHLLSYAQVSHGLRFEEPSRTDTAAVLKIALGNLRALMVERDAQVTSEDLPTVNIGATPFLQVMQNLVANGINYCSRVKPRIHISATQNGSCWLFKVRDNGIGIDSQYFERIFEPFQRLHGGGDRPGSGLGLAICKKIIEAQGGRIWVESEKGIGSTFLFTVAA